jgi:hypothetical protein
VALRRCRRYGKTTWRRHAIMAATIAGNAPMEVPVLTVMDAHAPGAAGDAAPAPWRRIDRSIR